MSIPYHLEIYKGDTFRLYINFSNVNDNVVDEQLTFHIYATNQNGTALFTKAFGINETRAIYKHLDSISVIRDGAKKSSKFIELTDDVNNLINQLNKSDLQTIIGLINKFDSTDKVNGLLSSLDDLEIENLHGAYHHKVMMTEIDNLNQLLALEADGDITNKIKNIPTLIKYSAGQPEKVFQNWIEKNLWVFGIEYIRKHDERKIALSSEADLLMETVDGYLDLIELKRPNHELLKFDSSHKCYYPHSDLSNVIGQSLHYIQKLFLYKQVIEEEYKVKVIMPRVKIIAGRNNDFNSEQKKTLRMLNSHLVSIQIITYDDIVSYGNLLVKVSGLSNK
jgi:hypothetical protein